MTQRPFLDKKFFSADRFILLIWALLPVISWAKDFFKGRYNNYKIFKGVFWHLVEKKNLYAQYPAEYGDINHYGPSFAIIIAPFAVLPDAAGVLLWGLFNVAVLYYAIRRLRLEQRYRILVMLLSTVELANAVWHNQFNPSVTAMLLLTYALVEDRQDFWAPLLIMAGTLIKLYTIVGLVFFLFSKQKLKFIAGCIVWFVVVLTLPMLFSSPAFVMQSYLDWYQSLAEKNMTSVSLDSSQDISLMGFVRRMTGDATIPNWPFLLGGALLVLLPLLRFSQYAFREYRMMLLCSLLMVVVLFSPGSEHPTYIICVTGIFLWMVMQPEIFSKQNGWIIFFVIVWTGLSPSDLLSVPVRKFTIAYALKAVPCIIVWGMVVVQLFRQDFGKMPDRFEKQNTDTK